MTNEFRNFTVDVDDVNELASSDDPQIAVTSRMLGKFCEQLIVEMAKEVPQSNPFIVVEALANLFSNVLTNFILLGNMTPSDAKEVHDLARQAMDHLLGRIDIEKIILEEEMKEAKRQPHTN